MPDNVQQLRRPYQQQLQVQGTDYAQIGMTACIAAVCTSVIAGGIALARGKKPFHDQMVKFRMIVVVSAVGWVAALCGACWCCCVSACPMPELMLHASCSVLEWHSWFQRVHPFAVELYFTCSAVFVK
jgi:hypothetical protein